MSEQPSPDLSGYILTAVDGGVQLTHLECEEDIGRPQLVVTVVEAAFRVSRHQSECGTTHEAGAEG